ncbi:MAG: PDZ domain-containing protein, partial [Bacteroidales bacterium]|nr:PDZ domain-containing protein [Bacteroidales bacterium]
MSEKRISSVWVAVLGVVLGALLVLTIQKATENSRRLKTRYEDWRKLNLVLQKVDEMYVDTVDYKTVTDAAISAALSGLDPHSVYMPPAELEESETDLAGNFDGIGIQFNVPNDTAIVLEVIPGGPSEKIGMLPGDRLLSVDDKVIAGVKFPQDSMVRRMKGPAGTKVTVTVLRDGVKIPFEITRGKIPVHSIDASFMVNDTTGYVRLSKVSRTTYNEFLNASMELLSSGMK